MTLAFLKFVRRCLNIMCDRLQRNLTNKIQTEAKRYALANTLEARAIKKASVTKEAIQAKVNAKVSKVEVQLDELAKL